LLALNRNDRIKLCVVLRSRFGVPVFSRFLLAWICPTSLDSIPFPVLGLPNLLFSPPFADVRFHQSALSSPLERSEDLSKVSGPNIALALKLVGHGMTGSL